MTNEINTLNDKVDSVDERLQNQITRINLNLENDISPRLQTIENCYLTTYDRYKNSTEQIEQLQLDVSVMKHVIIEHGEQLQKIS